MRIFSRGRITLLTVGLLLAACLIGGAFYVQRYLEGWLVTAGPLETEADVMVPRGTGMSGIAARLEEAGVVDNALLLRAAARLSGRDRRLQAGEYRFPPHVTPAAALDMIANGQRLLHRITVPEGQTVREAWDLLAAEDKLEGDVPPMPTEGGILPETYFFERGESRAQVAKRMQDAMRRTLDDLWAERAQDLPFATIEEAITLASIVEKETAVPAEYDLVAGVYVNRLRKRMPLQADPTVIYALTKGQSELGRPLTRRDLQVDDPYNTYKYPGLPPGPIALPGLGALRATLNPAETRFLYFVADGSGGHAFAETLDEHNRNVRNWRKVQAGAD